MSLQLDALPCKIVRYLPFNRSVSANAKGLAEAEDGMRYLIKSNDGNPLTCASEWISTSVSEFLHIPFVPCKVLQMRTGELVFGSQYLEPKLNDLETLQILFSRELPNNISIPDITPILSSIYALDLVLGNYDRHERNFLFSVEGTASERVKTARLRAIDYDAASIIYEPNPRLPMSENSQTVSVGRKIRIAHGFDHRASENALSRIYNGRKVMFERAMFGLPAEWYPLTKQKELLGWVESGSFEGRIERISQGLRDGTYL